MTLNYRLDENISISVEVEDSDKLVEFLNYFKELKPYLIRENLLPRGHESTDKKDTARPASEKQKATMVKFRIPFDDDITSAEASRLIEESINFAKNNKKDKE